MPAAKPKYLINTFGCQMNEHDSEKIAGLLEAMGYQPAGDREEADLILFNTCSVRDNPERKVYGQVAGLKGLKQRKPDLKIGICGCMVQQPEELAGIKAKLPQVDLVFGTHNIHELPELLQKVAVGEGPVIAVEEDSEEIVEGVPVRRESRLKAWVNITYGCNNFCTYCIVPYVRGREKSRDPEQILAEVTALGEDGCKEITLLGQNVNSYGRDLPADRRVDFADLLRRLNPVPGIERIRFTTSHPKDLSDKMISAMKELDKVCEHLHLPLQAGGNRILQRMNRGYTAEMYLELVGKLRQAIPEISLTTDLIVGFPGETEEDFEETLRVVREVRYDGAFTFIYSPRKGTPAAGMPDQVPEDVKRERIYRLIELQQGISREKNEEYDGQTVEVLVEGGSKTDPEILTGRTRTNKLVHFAGDPALTGELVRVKITNVHTWSLFGNLVDAGV
ncbi:MAG: tRNA (N6-isopentenyl adenosine(37)-C2)-methylthiotransferase MiaB [Firmicutes bacterium]|nr:tRNA (N6-isopentenyl adenosine(37)-C2)-methylthiotransferase MiaB [Bacillota bacterium]